MLGFIVRIVRSSFKRWMLRKKRLVASMTTAKPFNITNMGLQSGFRARGRQIQKGLGTAVGATAHFGLFNSTTLPSRVHMLVSSVTDAS